ncbi:ATP-dependent Clp protease ATP-binding subunit [Candidatus Uhrbacteria bacterium]|nr:ATP-dependent Clp protease ATP-binding subunit [Candidatus Uhrbacteria bacterium]
MEESFIQAEAVICATCGGDPRRSAHCKACGGAGIGIPSPDGFLVWTESIDNVAGSIRKFRIRLNAILHISLIVIIVGVMGTFVWNVLKMDQPSVIFESWEFWSIGHWYVTLFWFAIFLGCFTIYRITEFTSSVKTLPNWAKTKAQQKEDEKHIDQKRHQFRFDIAPYFSEEARTVVEQAYELASSLGRIEITPVTLFASALASSAGNIFMVRLGMHFDDVKGSIARLLNRDSSGKPPISLSLDARRVLALAYLDARQQNRKHVGVYDIFIQAFNASEKVRDLLDQLNYPPKHVIHVASWIRLREKMREEHSRFVQLASLKPNTIMNRAMTARQTPLLDRFSEDLTILARNGYVPPTIGRNDEIEEILRGLESGRSSVALVGPPGVGKSALIEQIARRMVEEDVPKILFDMRIVSINVTQLISSGDPSMAAERLLAMLYEVGNSGNIVLVLSNIESLVGSGTGGTMDLAEIFSSELDKGYFRAIVTTTPDAWTKYIERRSLGTKLLRINISEPDIESTLQVLMARSAMIEYQQSVFFSYSSLEKAASLSVKFIHEKAAPEKTLEVLREAAVIAKQTRGERTFVTSDDVAKVITKRTGIPVEAINKQESDKLLDMEKHLHSRVIGQDAAVTAVSQALRRARSDMREGKRPIANFLFLGPTGVGKTELSKALADEYFGSEESMIRLDMSEYQSKDSIPRMIGFPGDERGGLLTEAVRKRPFTIVLLDELEKAHPDILTLFLQVLDDGRLTDGIGRTIDFTNTMIIATSNAGTRFIQDEISVGTSLERIKTGLLEQELKGIFRPEFLNRFDGVIVFKPLTLDDVTQIAWLFMHSITKRLEEKGITFRAEDDAVEELAKDGFDPLFGARPLRRVIQERVDNALADALLRGEISRKDQVTLLPGGQLDIQKASHI